MKKRLEINGVIIILVVLLIAIFPGVFFRNGRGPCYDPLARFLGVALILLGQIFRTSARGYKAGHSRQGARLIQGGPYALVRNPMYLGILLIGLGMVLALFQWWAVLIFLIVFTLRYILLIFTEEKKLLSLFPQEYPLYLRQVPRLLPGPMALLKKNIRVYLPLELYWVRKELGTMLAVLLPTLLAEAWLVIKNDGMEVYFKEAVWTGLVILLSICFMIYLGRGEGGKKEKTSAEGRDNL